VRVVDVDADARRARELGELGRARCAEGLATETGTALAQAAELVAEALELLPADNHAWPDLAYLAGVAYAAGADPAGESRTGESRAWEQARTCFRRAARAVPEQTHPLWAAAHVAAGRVGPASRGVPWSALLDPPGTDEVGGALRVLGLDALVHLVPGTAVLTLADGTTRALDLPGLDDATRPVPADPDHGPAAVEELCAWAWTAAMGPVLAALPRSFARAPQLVLVPAGSLGAVPWHAAWSEVDGRRRHALQDAQISYIPAPRLLCESAARSVDPTSRRPTGMGRAPGDPVAFAPARDHAGAWRRTAEFLAAGSYSVASTLWPVPTDATELVLYMTEHYLTRRGLPPAQALRMAQLWMRDPKRGIPAAMPPELAARGRAIGPHDLADWAGFTHSGW
jgi:CHAT domain-containing protein